MKKSLKYIAELQSGIYIKPDIHADILYLQAVHFDKSGQFDNVVAPQLKLNHKIEKHLLQKDDILFAAKGIQNFAVVYNIDIGQAVASSSFIVIRIKPAFQLAINPNYLAWYINHNKKTELLQQQKIGTTVPSISIKQLREMEIIIPQIKKQNEIIYVQQLHDREKQLKVQLENLHDKLFQKKLRTILK